MREMLVVWLGWGQTQDTRHTWTTVTDGRVPETLGRSHPSANKDAPTARKIEYKNFIQEIEGAHTDVTWPGVFRAFFSLKMTLLYFGKSLSWEPCSGLLGSAAFFFFFLAIFLFKGRRESPRTQWLQFAGPQHISAPAGRRSPLPCADWACELELGGEARHRSGSAFAQVTPEGQPPLGPATMCICMYACVCGQACLDVCMCTSESRSCPEQKLPSCVWGGLACPQKPSPGSRQLQDAKAHSTPPAPGCSPESRPSRVPLSMPQEPTWTDRQMDRRMGGEPCLPSLVRSFLLGSRGGV